MSRPAAARGGPILLGMSEVAAQMRAEQRERLARDSGELWKRLMDEH